MNSLPWEIWGTSGWTIEAKLDKVKARVTYDAGRPGTKALGWDWAGGTSTREGRQCDGYGGVSRGVAMTWTSGLGSEHLETS